MPEWKENNTANQFTIHQKVINKKIIPNICERWVLSDVHSEYFNQHQ